MNVLAGWSAVQSMWGAGQELFCWDTCVLYLLNLNTFFCVGGGGWGLEIFSLPKLCVFVTYTTFHTQIATQQTEYMCNLWPRINPAVEGRMANHSPLTWLFLLFRDIYNWMGLISLQWPQAWPSCERAGQTEVRNSDWIQIPLSQTQNLWALTESNTML